MNIDIDANRGLINLHDRIILCRVYGGRNNPLITKNWEYVKKHLKESEKMINALCFSIFFTENDTINKLSQDGFTELNHNIEVFTMTGSNEQDRKKFITEYAAFLDICIALISQRKKMNENLVKYSNANNEAKKKFFGDIKPIHVYSENNVASELQKTFKELLLNFYWKDDTEEFYSNLKSLADKTVSMLQNFVFRDDSQRSQIEKAIQTKLKEFAEFQEYSRSRDHGADCGDCVTFRDLVNEHHESFVIGLRHLHLLLASMFFLEPMELKENKE